MTLRIPYWALQGPILSSFQGYALGETVHESWPGGEACNLAHALFFGRTIEQLANLKVNFFRYEISYLTAVPEAATSLTYP